MDLKAKVHTSLVVVMATAMALATLLACGAESVAEKPLWHASWVSAFKTTQVATDDADLVVVGEITASVFGRGNGFEVYPTEHTYVTVRVEEVLKGEFTAGQTLVFEHLGSAGSIWYDEMPEFGVGERHLLFLETMVWDGSEAGYVVMGPSGRYKVGANGNLETTSDAYGLTKTFEGKSLTAAKGEIAVARERRDLLPEP